jgi:integrase/recombinase XerD
MKHLPLFKPHFETLLEGFEESLRAKGMAGANRYGTPVREFLFFIENKAVDNIREVTAMHVVAYYDYLRERPNGRGNGGLSDSSLRNYLFYLRLFFDHLIDIGVLVASPVHLPRFGTVKRNERSVATVEEIKLLYKVAENKRDKVILSLAYGCGLRRTEILRMDTGDISLSQGTLTVRRGKFGKTRTIPMSDGVIRDIREYMIHERTKNLWGERNPSPSLIIDPRGERPQAVWLYNRVKWLVEKSGSETMKRKEISLHCLRHSIATHLIDSGASIEFVRRFLGHVALDTTHIYSKRRKQQKILLEQIERTGLSS